MPSDKVLNKSVDRRRQSREMLADEYLRIEAGLGRTPVGSDLRKYLTRIRAYFDNMDEFREFAAQRKAAQAQA